MLRRPPCRRSAHGAVSAASVSCGAALPRRFAPHLFCSDCAPAISCALGAGVIRKTIAIPAVKGARRDRSRDISNGGLAVHCHTGVKTHTSATVPPTLALRRAGIHAHMPSLRLCVSDAPDWLRLPGRNGVGIASIARLVARHFFLSRRTGWHLRRLARPSGSRVSWFRGNNELISTSRVKRRRVPLAGHPEILGVALHAKSYAYALLHPEGGRKRRQCSTTRGDEDAARAEVTGRRHAASLGSRWPTASLPRISERRDLSPPTYTQVHTGSPRAGRTRARAGARAHARKRNGLCNAETM